MQLITLFLRIEVDRLREGFENGEEDRAAGSEEEVGKALLGGRARGHW